MQVLDSLVQWKISNSFSVKFKSNNWKTHKFFFKKKVRSGVLSMRQKALVWSQNLWIFYRGTNRHNYFSLKYYYLKDGVTFLPVLKLGDDHNWTKGLLLGDEHIILHVRKHSRLKEQTWSINTKNPSHLHSCYLP